MLVATVIVLGLSLALFLQWSQSSNRASLGTVELEDGGGVGAEDRERLHTSAQEAPERSLPTPEGRSSRSPSPDSLTIIVHDRAGSPVEGAEVSLSSAGGGGDDSQLPSIARGVALAEAVEWGITDVQGRITWAILPERVGKKSLGAWITHPRFVGEFRRIEPGLGATLIDVSLDSAPEFTAMVVDVDGEPVPEATVYELGVSRQTARLYGCSWEGDALEEAQPPTPEFSLPLFVRVGSTGPDGTVSIPRPRASTVFVASADGRVSGLRPVDTSDQAVTLQVLSRQTARGRVHSAVGSLPLVGATVQCQWRSGTQRRPVFVSRVRSDGEWGPIDLPAFSQGLLSFRLSGGDLVPVEQSRSADQLLDTYVVDFYANNAGTQWAKVADSADQPISDARVEISWVTQSGELHAEAWTGPDGRAAVRGCPQTQCDFRVTKPGYAQYQWAGIYVVTPGDIEVTLQEAGIVTGEVRIGDRPVGEFQIHSWVADPGDSQIHHIPSAADGRFRLNTLPTGRVTLIASSAGLQESNPVTVDLAAGVPQSVVLQLKAGRAGYGQVVDSYSGSPILGAAVEVLVEHSGEVVGSKGVGATTDAAGRFEVSGLPEGSSTISVAYPGRVGVQGTGEVDANQRVNYGVIPIAARQDLAVRLLGEAPFETNDVWFMADGPEPIGYLPIDPSGQLMIPDVAPGVYSFMLVWDDGSVLKKREDLRPGEAWAIEFEYAKGGGLEVQLLPIEGQSLPADLKISAGFTSWSGEWVSRAVPVGAEGRSVFDYIPDGSVFIQVAQGSYINLLATKEHHLGGSNSRRVEIELSGRSIEITAVDPKGNLLDEGFITINPMDSTIRWVSFQHLNSTDPLTVGGISLDEVGVSVRHPELGLGFETVTMNPEGTTQVTVEVGNGLPLELRIRDLDGPVPAVRCMLIPKGVTTRGYQADSDATGALRYPGMPPHTYTADLDRYGYWPVDHEFEFRGEPVIELPIRRRGNFEATIYGAGGAQIHGLTVDLHSLEFDTPVSTWIESGRITSESGNLTSDVQGRVFAKGIPRGAYRWSLTKPDGSELSGVVEVPPGATANEVILLEE